MNTNSNSDVVVRFAESDAERLAAYHVRYRVFTEEQHDERYADHERQSFRDSLDGAYSRLLVAVAPEGIVGTSRLTLRRDGPLVADELYRWDLLSERFQESVVDILEYTSLWDRGAILPDYRRSGIGKWMENMVAEEAARQGCRYAVGTVKADNQEMRAFLRHCQWIEFASNTINDVPWFQLVKQLNRNVDAQNTIDSASNTGPSTQVRR